VVNVLDEVVREEP